MGVSKLLSALTSGRQLIQALFLARKYTFFYQKFYLVSMQGILGVGEPSGGLVVTRVMKSERSTRLPHKARINPVPAREGTSITSLDCFNLKTDNISVDGL